MDKLLNQKKEVKNEQVFDWGGVKQEQEKIVEMVRQIDDKNILIKIYTFAKTLKDILNEKEGG